MRLYSVAGLGRVTSTPSGRELRVVDVVPVAPPHPSLSARSHPPKARHRFEGWWRRPTGCTLRQLVAVATIKPEEQVMVIGSSAAMPVAGALGLFAIVIVGFLRAMLKGV
jgi:hypothetical protein